MYHNKDNLTENKLLLLYALYKIRQHMSTDQLTELTSDLDLMNYFDMRQHLLELAEDGLIRTVTEDRQEYHEITADGLATVSLFKKSVSPALRERMDTYLMARRTEFRRQLEISASYTEDSPLEFPVVLRIRENNAEIFHMELSVPDSSMASELCRVFRAEGPDIYADLVRRLTENDPKKEG